jgi:hypothetical protein
MIPTPTIMPIPDLRPISHLISNKSRNKEKINKTHAHPFGPNKLIGTPSSPHAIILVSREFNETSFKVKSLYVQISLSLDGNIQ